MQYLKNKIQQTDKKQLLYFIGFFFIITGSFLNTTMFPIYPAILRYINIAGFIIIFFKIVLSRNDNIKLFLVNVFIIILSVVVGMISDSYHMLFGLAMITTGAVNVPFKKIAKEYFYITFILLTVTIICSLTGAIPNLQYTFESERGVRNSFGIVYPTDFAAHVLFIMLSFVAAYEEKLKLYHSAIGIGIAVCVYIFCDTRVDCICMVLACVGVPVIKALKKANISSLLKKISANICIWSMPVACAVMIFITTIYTPSSPFLSWLNGLINGRLSLGREGFDRYAVTPFGQPVALIGAGGSTEVREDYFFLDCSYIYCLLKFGVIITLLLVTAYVFIGMRYRHSGLMLWSIAIIALNCMISHHLPDVGYIIFTAALFAGIDDIPLQNKPQPTLSPHSGS